MSGRGYRTLVGRTNLVGYQGSSLDDAFSGRVVVGAEAQAMAQNQAAMERRLAEKHATAVVDTVPNKSRRWPFGFPAMPAAPAGGTIVTSAQPQCLFRGERLVFPSDIAGGLDITDLKVGKTSQFAVQNPIPARAYSEMAWGVDLYLDTADVSMFVTLNVTNNSLAQIQVKAMLLGRAVE